VDVGLSVDGLTKSYAGTSGTARALDGVDFVIEEGKFYTLLGPSGCGKTTALRCIAGLERADTGTIQLGVVVVSSHVSQVFVRPSDRNIGMVFQSYAIWPHMTVFENVAFPLKATKGRGKRLARREIRTRVLDVLEKVRLAEFEHRMATKLSGGQQQRLALARALVRRPQILLLDEPLSNLDATLREEMRTELRRLQREVGVTTLYVTHDQAEALSMSNKVAVMQDGRIVQEATPREIYRSPATKFVANFVGRTNILEARVLGRGGGAVRLDTHAGQITARSPADLRSHEKVSLSIRPEDVRLTREMPSGDDRTSVLAGRVETVLFLGESVEYHVSVGKESILARQHPRVEFKRLEEVFVELPAEHCIVVSDEPGSPVSIPETNSNESS